MADEKKQPPAPPNVPDRINLVEQSGEYLHKPYDSRCSHSAAINGGWKSNEIQLCDGKRVLFCGDCVKRYKAGAELVVRGRPQPRK
jgi:hypothetical protein